MSMQTDVTDPIMRAFLDKINAAKGPQIYELSPQEARKVLAKVQEVSVRTMPATIDDREIPGGPKGKIPIRIVRPKESRGILPAVMYFHGGGWVMGGRDIHDRLIREIANKADVAVIFVEYTPSPEAKYPVPIEESYAALEYVAKNAKSLNVDASRLAVAGDSVGGNMAAVISMLAKQRKGPHIAFQVLLYPVTDAGFDTPSYKKYATGHWLSLESMKWFWDQYLPNKDARKQPTASPLQASIEQLKGLPPALVITNEFDVLRDEGEAYAHKLAEAGVSVTAVRFLNTIHDFMMLNALANSTEARSAIDLTAMMIKNALSKNIAPEMMSSH